MEWCTPVRPAIFASHSRLGGKLVISCFVLLLSLLVAMFGLRQSRVVCEDTGDRCRTMVLVA